MSFARDRYAVVTRRASIVLAMDVVAIVLGIVMFAILLVMVEGIDRV